MKPLFNIIIALLSLGLFTAGCAGLTSPTSTVDPNAPLIRLRIGVNTDLPPFVTYDAARKEVSGFDVELMKTLADRAGIFVEFVNVATGQAQLLSQVGQCRLDGGISAIPVMDALKNQVDFSDPYFSTGQVLVVKKGNIKITGPDAVSGMVVGTQAKTLSSVELEKMSGVQPREYPSYFLAFQDLISGNIDAVIADHPRAWLYVKVKPNNLKIVGDEFSSLSYGIAFCKNQKEILQKLNTSLAAIQKDGTLDKLVQKWALTTYDQ